MQGELLFVCGLVLGIAIVGAAALLRSRNKKNNSNELEFFDSIEDILELQFQFRELHDEFRKSADSCLRALTGKSEEIRDLMRIADEKILYFNSVTDELEGKMNRLDRKIMEYNKLVSESEKKKKNQEKVKKVYRSYAAQGSVESLGDSRFSLMDRKLPPQEDRVRGIDIVLSDHEPLQ